jgi:hypothetical protein
LYNCFIKCWSILFKRALIFLIFLKTEEFSIIYCSCCTSSKDEKIWLNNATILKDFADLQAIQHNLYNRNFHSIQFNLINEFTVVTYRLTNSDILASLICWACNLQVKMEYQIGHWFLLSYPQKNKLECLSLSDPFSWWMHPKNNLLLNDVYESHKKIKIIN